MAGNARQTGLQVARLDQEKPAHLLAGLEEWATGRCQLSVANTHRGGRARRLQRLAANRALPNIPSRVEIAIPRPI